MIAEPPWLRYPLACVASSKPIKQEVNTSIPFHKQKNLCGCLLLTFLFWSHLNHLVVHNISQKRTSTSRFCQTGNSGFQGHTTSSVLTLRQLEPKRQLVNQDIATCQCVSLRLLLPSCLKVEGQFKTTDRHITGQKLLICQTKVDWVLLSTFTFGQSVCSSSHSNYWQKICFKSTGNDLESLHKNKLNNHNHSHENLRMWSMTSCLLYCSTTWSSSAWLHMLFLREKNVTKYNLLQVLTEINDNQLNCKSVNKTTVLPCLHLLLVWTVQKKLNMLTVMCLLAVNHMTLHHCENINK